MQPNTRRHHQRSRKILHRFACPWDPGFHPLAQSLHEFTRVHGQIADKLKSGQGQQGNLSINSRNKSKARVLSNS
jgi:hypothetical protein